MTDLRKAMKMALEALETKGEHHERVYAAIKTLRQALAQPEPWDTSDMAHRSGGLTVDVTDLINRAKAEEREACAKFFDANDTLPFWGSAAARAIRARSKHEQD
jgi:hypothetical protein